MSGPSPQQVTQLLQAWSDGDQTALERLMPLVYKELRQMAQRHMARERPGRTLQTTALVHEAYLRLVDWKNIRWQNRAHFFAVLGTDDAAHPGRPRARPRLGQARRRSTPDVAG